MALVNSEFRKSPQITALFDYEDIISGFGYVTFFLGGIGDNLYLLNDPVATNTTSINKNTSEADRTFTSTEFSQQREINGNVYFEFGGTWTNASGNPNLEVGGTLKKISGGTTTTIGTLTGYDAHPGTDGQKRGSGYIEDVRTVLKKGDKLQFVATISAESSSNFGMMTDPKNASGTHLEITKLLIPFTIER